MATTRSREENNQMAQPQELPKLDNVEGVLGWVQAKKEESKKEGNSWGWVIGLIMAIIVFFALAYAAYTAWKKGREIAKLKHKIDVDEEKKKQAQANAKIEKNSLEAANLEKVSNDLQVTIDKLKDQIKKTEAERKKLNNKINTITSWEDVDSL